MVGRRIEDILGGELTSPASGDLLVILDKSDTSEDPDGTTKYIECFNITGGLGGSSYTAGSGLQLVGSEFNIHSRTGHFSELDIDNIHIDGNIINASNANGSLTIAPTGNGHLKADPEGNARGEYAVDLQLARSSNTQVANGLYATIGGGQKNTASQNSTTVGGGDSNTASDVGCTVGGGLGCQATETYSTVGGGNTNRAIDDYSTVAGGYFNQADAIVSSVGGGWFNHCVGYGGRIGGGRLNDILSTASYSTIPGGYLAKTTMYGQFGYANGTFDNDSTNNNERGAAQYSILVSRIYTTGDESNTTLWLDNGKTERMVMPQKTVWNFDIQLAAYTFSGELGAGWNFRGVIRRDDSNNTSIIGSPTEESWSEGALTGAFANVVADDTNEALEIQVTGVPDRNVRWVAATKIVAVSNINERPF